MGSKGTFVRKRMRNFGLEVYFSKLEFIAKYNLACSDATLSEIALGQSKTVKLSKIEDTLILRKVSQYANSLLLSWSESSNNHESNEIANTSLRQTLMSVSAGDELPSEHVFYRLSTSSIQASKRSVPRNSIQQFLPMQNGTVRPPAHFYFVISAVFHYMGPAFAVLLFAHLDVLGVAWLRIASAALIFAVWKKPWRCTGAFRRKNVHLVCGFGFVIAAMNVTFYLAINKLPLGTVAAVEFIAPISIAAAGTRTRRNAIALILASVGVYLLTHLITRGDSFGLLFAFANCFLFGLYVLLGHCVAAEGGMAGIDSLCAAMCVALVAVTPLGIGFIGPALRKPILLLAGAGVGVSSSVIPYVCDQLAMARLRRSTFALLLALLPAIASIMGALILRQTPSSAEMIGTGLVMTGVAVQSDGAR